MSAADAPTSVVTSVERMIHATSVFESKEEKNIANRSGAMYSMTEVKATQKRLASADGHNWASMDCNGRESTATSTVLSVTLTAIANNRAIRAVMIFSLLQPPDRSRLPSATLPLSAPIEQARNASTQLHQQGNLRFGEFQHLFVPAPD